MSKERAIRRAERQVLARTRAAEVAARNQKDALRRRRRQRAHRAWARMRLWRTGATAGAAAARAKERRVVVGSILVAVIVASYLLTASISIVIGVTLIAAIATPALVAAFFDRSSK